MIKKLLKDKNRNLVLFLLIVAATSLATGLSNTVFSNYFKEAYDITAYQRGVLEFPRELPGLICLLVIGIGSFLGDVRVAVIAQVFSFAGIMALGLLTPMFTIMSIYLFINSLGMHTMLPLRDSIGISLIKDKSNFGKRLGQYGGTKTAFKMVAGFIVFFGFKFGLFK